MCSDTIPARFKTRNNRFIMLLSLAVAGMMCGCGSGYQRFFESSIANPHPPLADYDRYNLAVYSGEPIVYSQSEDGVVRRLIEDGFVILGRSSFNGPAEGGRALREQARRIGAEVVVAESKYSHTVSGAMPVTNYSPTTSYSTGTITSSSGGWASYSGTSTGTLRQTSMMPYSIARYDQGASFWTRTVRPRVLGANVVELSPSDRQKIGTNQGVKVLVCVRDSPAWKANILPDDYVLAIGSHKIQSVREFHEQVHENAGQQVTVAIQRGETKLDVSVSLNPSPMGQTSR